MFSSLSRTAQSFEFLDKFEIVLGRHYTVFLNALDEGRLWYFGAGNTLQQELAPV
jgi:hypothetical protein